MSTYGVHGVVRTDGYWHTIAASGGCVAILRGRAEAGPWHVALEDARAQNTVRLTRHNDCVEVDDCVKFPSDEERRRFLDNRQGRKTPSGPTRSSLAS
jgi:hypothetical protein